MVEDELEGYLSLYEETDHLGGWSMIQIRR